MIVFVATNPWHYGGGSEYLWQRTAGWLLRQGHPVGICVHHLGPVSVELENLRKEGAVLHFRKVPGPRKAREKRGWRLSLKRWLRRTGPALPEGGETLRWIKRQNPRLVVINHMENYDGAWWMESLATSSVPFVTVTHNGGAELWPSDYYVDRLLTGLHASCRNYFPSKNSRDWMEVQLGAPIPNASLFKSPHQVRYRPDCAWPENTDILRLAMVGRLDPKAKGHELAFRVLASDVWRDRAVELNIYGGGPSAEGLQRLAKHWNLSHVHFHGEVSDIEEVWKKNHFLLQPSRFEGLPCTLMEAMLCGRGAIVTDVGGNAELVEEGVSGFIAAYPETKSLALALEKCWLRRLEAREIGRAARYRAEKCLPEEPEMIFGQELLELCAAGRPLAV